MPCFLFQAPQEQRQHPASPPLQSAHGMAKEAGAAQTDIPRGKSRDAGSVGRPVEKRPVPDWQAGARPHLQQYPPQGCIPGQMPQCAASAVAGRCIAQRSALHRPTQRAALPIAPRCVFRPIAEQDSVDPLSGEKAVQSVSIQKPQRNSKESPFHPNPKPTAAMATSPNKTADCDATTEASQSAIHSGALPPPRQPNSQFKRQCSLLRMSVKPQPRQPNSQFKKQCF